MVVVRCHKNWRRVYEEAFRKTHKIWTDHLSDYHENDEK